jgi:hypothetical protein
MAHAVVFDTLAYANKLKQSGVSDKQAETQAQALAEIFEERVATKQDIDSLKFEIKAEFNAKFADYKAEIIKWVIGVSAAQGALILSALKFFHH